MPRAIRSNLAQQSHYEIRLRNIVNESTADEQEITREECRDSMTRIRASQTQHQREAVHQSASLAIRNRRSSS